MQIINSLFSALLMYSRIPAPQVEWKEENRRYALCFFPLIGLAIGAGLWLIAVISRMLSAGNLFAAVIAAVWPLLVTGGIHMDGFLDVTDAKASCAPKEKKLEILKDPHIGAFAMIYGMIYLALQIAAFSELFRLETAGILLFPALGYVSSRCYSGLAALLFPCAKKKGSLQDFSLPAHRKRTILALSLQLAVCTILLIAADPAAGLIQSAAAAAVFLYYRYHAMHQFGGITGDTEGWFVQIAELVQLFVITLFFLIRAAV